MSKSRKPSAASISMVPQAPKSRSVGPFCVGLRVLSQLCHNRSQYISANQTIWHKCSLVRFCHRALFLLSFFLDLVVPGGGIEPPTRGFSIHCSTPELPGQNSLKVRHLRQFLRVSTHGGLCLSIHDLSLDVCQCGPNVWQEVSKCGPSKNI